jgi:hypothetical protein
MSRRISCKRRRRRRGIKDRNLFSADAKVKGTYIIDIRNYWSIARPRMMPYG